MITKADAQSTDVKINADLTTNNLISFSIAVPFIKIILPVSTRWNSVVMAMKTVVRIAPALKKIRERDLEIFRGKLPSDRQLDSFAEMLTPLLMIKAVSEQLEADKTPTLHLALPHLCKIGIMSRSKKFPASSNTTKEVIRAFEASLHKRVKDLGRNIPLYCMANILHPTYKGRLLNFDDDVMTYDRMIQQIKEIFPEVHPDSQKSQVRRPHSHCLCYKT